MESFLIHGNKPLDSIQATNGLTVRTILSQLIKQNAMRMYGRMDV